MLARIGSCNHCGICCLREGGLMVENPMIELHEDRCKFYELGLDKHCLILSRKGSIKKVKDRFGTLITQEQVDWFNANCIDYPLAKDAEIGVHPPPECSFSFEVQIDG